MKTKIEALSNAFNIGFEIGAKPYNADHINSIKAALKRAIEEGLAKMSSQQPNAVDAKKPCGFNHPGLADSGDNFCKNCGERLRTTD